MIRIANLSNDSKYFKWLFVPEPFDFNAWVKEEKWVLDCDICNDYTNYWVVMTDPRPTYYKVYHSYWVEDSEDWYVANEFETSIVDVSQLDKYAKKNLKFVV